ncbi:alpha/beta fold hydrolase [Streptomyces sp. YIM 98790]|uniref:alpha/beta fold hydrolase n=1 Tax=Streptomyces sp. YIM 98790 TaxID=2689077 RepID=UPI00140C14B7|nr:alpha/beta hydrolase [Streptomyces sp. YIM 98790]
MTDHHTLELRGQRIESWTAGPPDGPLVTCTHGLSMDHRMFDRQTGPLTAAGYRVLVWDLPGHGASKPLRGRFSVGTAAGCLADLITALGHRQSILVGHSLGGFVSQELLHERPGMVRALVVVGNNSLTTPLPLHQRLALRLSPLLFLLRGDSWRRKVVSRETAATPEAREYAYDATSRMRKREFVSAWAGMSRCLRPEPDYRIPCPFLLTLGEHDETGTVADDPRRWAEREPDSDFAVIPGAGHNANQDNPDFFNRLLLDFLTERTGPARV